MKKVIIIGAGFAGLSAGNILRRKKDIAITLIDSRETSDFLPLLPDCIGRKINPEYLAYDINKTGFKFIKEEVVSVDLEKKQVVIQSQSLGFDYLIIASGSETNFYGNENIRQNAYKLNGVKDVRGIINALEENNFDNYIIAGAGYTGIEVATNLRRNKPQAKIIIIERAPGILGLVQKWMQEYVARNLAKLKIDVLTQTTIDRIEDKKVYLSGNKVFENALVVWAAGVKTAAFVQNIKAAKNPQGRLKVDECLRINDNCFVVGDAAYFAWQNNFLRMAVQFAIVEGRLAAKNILRSIKGSSLIKYKPIDLGYIIPMANNRSCGRVLGINLKGRLQTLLHFMMCIYRSYGIKNKLGIIGNLIKVPRTNCTLI